MKYYDLTGEEKRVLEDLENDRFVSVGNLKDAKRKYQKYARTTLNKTKNINIRLSEKDVLKLKSQAVENGIPYQTLISLVLHRLANKKDTASL